MASKADLEDAAEPKFEESVFWNWASKSRL
jgi:hypothetical protein